MPAVELAVVENPPQEQPGWLSRIVRNMLLFFAVQMVVNMVVGSWLQAPSPVVANSSAPPRPPVLSPPSRNAIVFGTLMTLHVYVTEATELGVLESVENGTRADWVHLFTYGDWADAASTTIEVTPGARVTTQNGTLHLHAVACVQGTPLPLAAEAHEAGLCVHHGRTLTPFYALPVDRGRRHLLAASLTSPVVTEDGHGDTTGAAIVAAHWNSVLHVGLVTDDTVLPHRAHGLPAAVASRLRFDADARYFPVLTFNEFWDLREDYFPINDTTPILTLNVTFSPLSMMKWQLLVQMDESFAMQEQWGAQTANDKDNFKKMLRDTNVYLLALTFAVTILHSVFDFLAFKNDVAFWKNRKSMAGLSLRSIFLSVGCQLIILLYLFDQPETSKIILLSGTVGLAIECWKLRRAATFVVTWRRGVIPCISVTGQGDYTSTTSEHDKKAFEYLSLALAPLFVCYTAYSLMYNEHTGWYSFVIATLAGAVYTFGFIMMTPQLFINYKLKSVAHLPWRMLTYKALNTFVDDLFAFIIHMPLMHRIACFRDDIIFFVYIYQRWIYRVDPARRNEYGVTGADMQAGAGPEAGPETSPEAVSGSAVRAPEATGLRARVATEQK